MKQGTDVPSVLRTNKIILFFEATKPSKEMLHGKISAAIDCRTEKIWSDVELPYKYP